MANRRADTGQSTFHSLSNKLFKERDLSLHEPEFLCGVAVYRIAEYIRKYCPDRDFIGCLETEDILNSVEPYEVRYLLYELEKHKCEEAREAAPQWKELNKATIEHIWPQNPRGYGAWSNRKRQKHASYVGNIGNLTLTFWNPELSNKDFSEKNRKYRNSSLRVQRELAEWDEWTPAEISGRTREIVEFALDRWAAPE
jgi:hypothetical protein